MALQGGGQLRVVWGCPHTGGACLSRCFGGVPGLWACVSISRGGGARAEARWGSISVRRGPISERKVFLECSWHKASFAAIPRVWDPLGREPGPKGGSAGSLRGRSDDCTFRKNKEILHFQSWVSVTRSPVRRGTKLAAGTNAQRQASPSSPAPRAKSPSPSAQGS